jgi:RNA polymerase sigma-70 factor (ECF subfamily)
MTTSPTIPSDADLLKLMEAGDERAFATIYRRHQPQLYRFALLMGGSAHVAEDVTQEVFMALIRESHRYDRSRGPLSAYLYGIARNCVLRILERERPYVPLAEEADGVKAAPPKQLIARDDPLSDCERHEVMETVCRAVLSLPARYREVVVLCEFQELSHAEAAAVVGCAVGTVSSRVHRGHALLVEKLRSAGPDNSPSRGVRPVRCYA